MNDELRDFIQKMNYEAQPAPEEPRMSTGPSTTPSEREERVQSFIRNIKQVDPELYSMSMVETSGGRNLKHPTITSKTNMNYGHTAGGPWGLMPLTVGDIVKRNPDIAEKYPELETDPKEDPNRITHFLNMNPQAAYELTKREFERRKRLFSGDEDKAIHSWYYGPARTMRYLKEGKNIKEDDYVKKYHNYYPKINNMLD